MTTGVDSITRPRYDDAFAGLLSQAVARSETASASEALAATTVKTRRTLAALTVSETSSAGTFKAAAKLAMSTTWKTAPKSDTSPAAVIATSMEVALVAAGNGGGKIGGGDLGPGDGG